MKSGRKNEIEMKNTLKVLSVMVVALVVVFSTAGASLAASTQVVIPFPGVLANCHTGEDGLTMYCDAVTSLRGVNDFYSGVVATSLRGVNDFSSGVVATSLRGINDLMPVVLEMPSAFHYGAR